MKPLSYYKVGLDLFVVQLSWTFFAVGIFLLINILRMIFWSNPDDFYSSGYIAGNIYMLVIGIIAITFLNYSVENGITRKNYYFGNVIASVGLSIIIPIIIYLINLIETFIVHRFTNIVLEQGSLENIVVEVDGNIIADIIQAMILTPFISPETNLLLSLGLFSLNLFIFYIIGWLIGAAFKRFNWVLGIVFIAVALALYAVKDSMVRLILDIPLYETFSFMSAIPESLAIPLIIAVILVTLVLIRLFTRRVEIDI